MTSEQDMGDRQSGLLDMGDSQEMGEWDMGDGHKMGEWDVDDRQRAGDGIWVAGR